jgi:TolB-like protein/class 3 adenylate cyclase
MADEGFKRKLAAILSADVEGYSRLMDDDEEATVRTLTTYRTAIAELVQKFRGRVVDSPGDNILAEFASVVDAVNCAVEIQRELAKQNAELPDNRQMQFRIGVNLGDVIEEEGRIYGDGVNIAARIEGLADAGGVCVSRTAYDHIRKKLRLGYEFLGEHSVKNISEPVAVYKVLMDEKDAGKLIGAEKKTPQAKLIGIVAAAIVVILLVVVWQLISQKPAEIKKDMPSPVASEKSSIAVMPFDNMSSDPDHEYFGDGISEDLITDLSKIPDLLVISRLSSFTYKGKSVKSQQIGEELGVRYLLEGSVRKANGNVRINAQLIDAATGHHLWAERYDGNTSDIFALQDKITRKIAASLAVKLTKEDEDHLTRKDTDNIEAYEAYLKGTSIANSLRNDPEKFVESLPWFEKAVELDPEYSLAYAALAETYLFGSSFGIQNKLGISTRLARIRGDNYIRLAMKNPTNIAYRNVGRYASYKRQHEKSLDFGMRAIDLGPYEYKSNAFMAQNLVHAGKPDEGILYAERMRRADPACLF